MRRLTLAIALACVLSGVAHAGEIHSTGMTHSGEIHPTGMAEEIPSTGATAPSSVTVTGEIHTTGAPAPEESSTVLTIILTLISIVN